MRKFAFIFIMSCCLSISIFGQTTTHSLTAIEQHKQTLQKLDSVLNTGLKVPNFADFYTIQGVDKKGHQVDFKVVIITQEERWKLASFEEVETGKAIDILPTYFSQLSLVKASKNLICIGTASQEGNQKKEAERAGRRADVIVKVLKVTLGEEGAEKHIFKLNLGKFKVKARKEDTSYQRRVILIGTIEEGNQTAAADIQEALFDALEKSPNLEVKISDYHDFKLLKVQ